MAFLSLADGGSEVLLPTRTGASSRPSSLRSVCRSSLVIGGAGTDGLDLDSGPPACREIRSTKSAASGGAKGPSLTASCGIVCTRPWRSRSRHVATVSARALGTAGLYSRTQSGELLTILAKVSPGVSPAKGCAPEGSSYRITPSPQISPQAPPDSSLRLCSGAP